MIASIPLGIRAIHNRNASARALEIPQGKKWDAEKTGAAVIAGC